MMTNLWIDDERNPPEGWIWVKTSLDAIKAIRTCQFEAISFDHDLGETGGTGYEVLLYLEAEVFRNPEFRCPKMLIHSANPVGRQRMQQAINSINKELRRVEFLRLLSLAGELETGFLAGNPFDQSTKEAEDSEE
jgi:hypothetical protein